MFTGIVTDVGRIAAIERSGDEARMRFSTRLDMRDWRLGDSVAVNGCCLTITAIEGDLFDATLSAETLRLTTFGAACVGDPVNLEPALRVGDRLGGHIVSGHVDGIGRLTHARERDGHREMRFALPFGLARLVVRKGSVAVHGVSLTVNEAGEADFTVNLIPHTLSHTNLGALRPGDPVNIEVDMLGRYVERLLCRQEGA